MAVGAEAQHAAAVQRDEQRAVAPHQHRRDAARQLGTIDRADLQPAALHAVAHQRVLHARPNPSVRGHGERAAADARARQQRLADAADEADAPPRLVVVERLLRHDEPRLRARPQVMRAVLGDLAHGEVEEAVGRAVRLHGVAVVASEAGRVEGQPDVAEVVLHDLLHAGRGERDLVVRRVVREGELLRAHLRRQQCQGEQEVPRCRGHGQPIYPERSEGSTKAPRFRT